jgi:hypothetical protein
MNTKGRLPWLANANFFWKREHFGLSVSCGHGPMVRSTRARLANTQVLFRL